MKRSKHSLSNYKLLTMNQGPLVPIGLMEVLPGDSIQHATSALIRTAPLLAPVMHPVHVKIHHWFVPHRLVWDDFEKFITGGPDGMDASVFPTRHTGARTLGDLSDYLGISPVPGAGFNVSALPFRGYALIFNEWYRDQDLQTELVISKASGTDSTTSVVLQNSAWEKDYFTTARPFAQKGPDVTLPLGTSAPVILNPASTSPLIYKTASGHVNVPSDQVLSNPSSQVSRLDATATTFDPNGNWLADLTNASAADINELRRAMAIQRYQEARARYGSRYSEYLRYLGVRSSDARLQRPEYLGGGKQTIQFSEVVQTAEGSDPVGTLRGHGIGAMRSNRYRRFFEEHGYVFTLMSVQPISCYVQGLPRTWNRRSKEDFFQKELQHIGQQEILNKELYIDGVSPDGVFGFQDRYDEYRRTESSVAGEFRTTLDYWHMGRVFTGDPVLNASFVSSNPTNRIYAAPSANQLYVMANHSIQARRLVDVQGNSYIF